MTTKRFTGQYHEQALPGGEGLAYYNARWYDPALGRFISADTLVPSPSNPQDFNRYSYVRNNPLRFTDPTGHYIFENEPSEIKHIISASSPNNPSGQPIGVNYRPHYVAQHSLRTRSRVYYLNAIGNVRGSVFSANSNPADEQGYILHKLGQTVGQANVKHIPIFHGNVFDTRLQMLAEMYEYRIWSPTVASTITQDLTQRPLKRGEKLTLVGNSGGGTIAIESLDLLAEEGIYVDHVILRGSPVHEYTLRNVGRVDYITSNFDYYYSFDINPFDGVSVQSHRLDFWGHVPPNANIRKQIGDLIAGLIANNN